MPPLSSAPRCIACVVLPSIPPFGASLDTAILSYPLVQETGSSASFVQRDCNPASYIEVRRRISRSRWVSMFSLPFQLPDFAVTQVTDRETTVMVHASAHQATPTCPHC